MKKTLSLLLAISVMLTMLSGIAVFAEENQYVSAYETFDGAFTITSVNTDGKGAVETTIVPPSDSDLTYTATGTIQKGYSETENIYDWIVQKTDTGYNDLNSLYIRGFNGGNNHGVVNGKLDMGFDEITSGKVFISYRFKSDGVGYAAAMGALYSGENCAVSVNNATKSNVIEYYDGSTKKTISITDKNWHKISYYADLDTQKYELYYDDELIGDFNFRTSVTSFTHIRFGTYGTNFSTQNYYIDDIIVCEAPDTNTRTVNFYKNGEFLESQTVAFGSSVDFPEVGEVEGHNFSGWYGDANGETAVDLSCVIENENAYAVYKPYVIHEDFGRTTSFRIDKENSKILTDSGFLFTATSDQFNVMNASGGVLTTTAKNITGANSLTVNFDEITSGKARIGFRFQMIGHNGNGNATGFGSLVNQSYGLSAAYNRLRFGLGTETADSNKTENVLTKDNAWHTAEYRVDKTAGTYEFYFDGEKYGYTNLSGEYLDSFPIGGAVDSLHFKPMSHAPSNYNYALSDAWVVLDPDNNAKDLTITYMNEDNETVKATETVAFGGSIANAPDMEKDGKIFAGWTLNAGTEDVVNLGMIMKNYTLYPVYLTETPVEVQNITAEIGTVHTYEDAEASSSIVSDSLMAAGTVNGKNIVWTANGTQLRAYDFTDMANPSFIGEYTFDDNFLNKNRNRSFMVYSDGYLYAMSNNKNLRSIPIGNDGLPASAGTKNEVGADLQELFVIDDYIFMANSSGNIFVYQKGANPSQIATCNIESNLNNYIVRKLSDRRYRLFVSARGTNTTEIAIYDFIVLNDGAYAIKLVNRDVPALNENNTKWPNIEGSTLNGEGGTGGTIMFAGKNAVNVWFGTVKSESSSNNCNLITIDISDPMNMKVVQTVDLSYTARELKGSIPIGDNYAYISSNVDQSGRELWNFKNLDGIVRSATSVPSSLAIAYCGNRGYVASGKSISAFTLYEDGVYALTSGGTDVESVITNNMTVGAYVNSTEEKDAVLIAALYNEDGTIAETRIYEKEIKPGFNNLYENIDLSGFAHYNPMTTYLNVYLWDNMNTVIPLVNSKSIPSATLSGDGVFSVDTVDFQFYVGDDTEEIKGLFLMDSHGGGTTFFNSRELRSFLDKNDWAAILFVDGKTNPATLEMMTEFSKYADRANVAMETAIDAFASSSGHSELSNVPRATFGHSAATSFAVKYGEYNEDKVFASVAWRSHDKPVFTQLSKNVPVLINQGEVDGTNGSIGNTTGYGNNANQLGLSVALVNEGYPVTYSLAAGADHGSGGAVMDSCIIFPFLERAYEARVPQGADFSQGSATLNSIDFNSGYYGDLSNVYDYFMTSGETKEYEYGKIGEYTNDTNEYSWLFDEDFAALWKEYSETRNVK